MNKKIVVITGPTASGKSEIAEIIQNRFDGILISADSMQIYKYMDIGTAKSKTYLTDIVTPDVDFTVFDYVKLARSLIKNTNKLPILVGGSTFYLHGVLYGTNFIENIDEAYRRELESLHSDTLFEMLKEIDIDTANSLHKNNRKKVIRALEFYKTHKIKLSSHNEFEKKRKLAYDCKTFIINKERNILYENINKRVDYMIEKGLVEEVKNLLKCGYNKDMKSMGAIGYKEIIMHLEGEISLDTAVYMIKQNTRHFAKRQLTWLRNKTEGIWTNDKEEIIKNIEKWL